MKTFLKILFIIYHSLFPSRVATCRFQPTCSQYLLDSVQKHGPIKGLLQAIIRIIACNPLSKRPIIDPAQ